MKKLDRSRQSTQQKPSNVLHEGERITNRYYLANMTKWVCFCLGQMTYRDIAAMAGKSGGWWKLVATKQWTRIKPTPMEYRAIKLLYDSLRKFGGDTSGRRELARRILGHMGDLQRDIAELMRKA